MTARKGTVLVVDDNEINRLLLARQLEHAGLRHIFCSPLERARETAEPLAQRLGLPVLLSEALNEMDFGEWTLKPFAEWFNDMVQVTVAQYRFARTDAEQQYADAKAQGVSDLRDDLLERTVASNQRQIAATIVDLLAAYGRVLRSASSHDVAQFLVETCEPWKALDTFDVSERRLSAVYREALKLIKTTIEVQFLVNEAGGLSITAVEANGGEKVTLTVQPSA